MRISAYLWAMRFLDKLNPVGGVTDFWEYFKRPQPYRVPILLASAVMTLGVLSLIIWEKNYIAPAKPKVTWITTLDENRTDAQIYAENLENQRVQEELRAAEEAKLERRSDIYRALGRGSGMDVEAIDERIARERAEAEAKAEARRRELMQNVETPEEALADQPE